MKLRAGNKRALMPQLVQALDLLKVLMGNRFGLTIHELMAEVGLCKRTIYRYLNSFKAAGFKIESVRVNGGPAKKWRILDRRQWMSMTGIA